jgi:hypothetical protein
MNRCAGERLLALAAIAAALAAQEPVPRTLTEAWRVGLQRMRSQHAPGLVFVLPAESRDAKPGPARERLLATVATWLQPALPPWATPRPGSRQASTARDWQLNLLCALAVPIFAEPEACGAKPGETLLLLKPDGSRAEGFALDLADGDAVLRALTPILLSETSIAAGRAVVPPAALRDVDLVTQPERKREDGFDWWRRPPSAEQSEARRRLQARVHEVAPALVQFVDPPRSGAEDPPARVAGPDDLLMWLGPTVPLGSAGVPRPTGCLGPCGLSTPGPVGAPLWQMLKLLPK